MLSIVVLCKVCLTGKGAVAVWVTTRKIQHSGLRQKDAELMGKFTNTGKFWSFREQTNQQRHR
jgi:hypothetical protein